MSSLIKGIKIGDFEEIVFFLTNGANVNATDDDDKTPYNGTKKKQT